MTFSAIILSLMLTSQAGLVQEGPPSDSAPPAGVRIYTLKDFGRVDSNYRLYPEKALEDEVEGKVTLQCQIGENQKFRACAVLNERPMGYGFGKTAAHLVLLRGRVEQSSENFLANG